MNKSQFIKENIVAINGVHAKTFIKNAYENNTSPFETITEVQNFLKKSLLDDIQNSNGRIIDSLWKEFAEIRFVVSKIVEIANRHNYSKVDLKEFLFRQAKTKLIKKYEAEAFETLISPLMEAINTEENNEIGIRVIKKEIKNGLKDFLFMALQGGFSLNLQEINLGVMTANAGDSAQFIFVGRAVLAGFNCSNVDVRSSRYDVIIDFKDILLRIQVKGVSGGSTISFFDRPRGGQGIDHTHITNIGKRITGLDCDFYVAVDKRSAMCYIIPMSFADSLSDIKAKNVSLKELGTYKENWIIFQDFIDQSLIRDLENKKKMKQILVRSNNYVKKRNGGPSRRSSK